MSHIVRAKADVRNDAFPSVIRSFAERAMRNPDGVAIEASGHALTNRQLSQWSAEIAESLTKHGVVPDDRVAIIGPRGPAAVASMIATLSVGGVVVPLDASAPNERRQRMTTESGARVAIQITEGAALVSESLPLLRVPAWPDHEPAAKHLQVVRRTGSDPAYIFFTSGSTGNPKGVLGSWDGFTQFMHWMAETFSIDESDRVALTRNLGFDAVMREIFVPLLTGARIVVAPDPLDPDEAIAWLRNQRITVINATPSHAEMWIESLEASTSSLRWVFFSGEILTSRLVSDWRSRVSPTGQLVNFYGPTETTFIRTFQVVGETTDDDPIPIGSPLPGTEILILDEGNQPASRGEIVIRTAFGTLGYINVNDDGSFVVNPLTGDPGDIVYRTGDIGETRGDGSLVVVGRTDLQMKILGVRVEPGEIETKLEQHPTIKRAVIVPIEHGGRIVRVDAAIVPHGDPPTTATLREHLAPTIPRVAIPARYVVVDALPVNPNGKIDRAQISRLVAESSTVTSDPAPIPREDRLAALSPAKRALLERRLQGEAAKQKHEPTDTADRIAQLSPAKRALLEARNRTSNPDGQSVRRAPLSSAQERLWVLDRMYPGSDNYSITKAYILRGPLDVDTFRVACEHLAARHEILRTRYVATDGDPVQEVDPPGAVQFALIDLDDWPGDKRAEATRIRIEEASYPFNLAQDAIWRTTVVRLAPDEHLLVTVLHHIASDGWSMPILFTELSFIYNALRVGAEPDLNPLPIQYVDYSIRQRQALEEGGYEDDLTYWRDNLAGAPDIIDLKTDRTRPPIMTFGGQNLRFVLKHTTKNDFQTLARQESVTGFMLSLAVFIAHLHERSGSDDVVVGIPSADRGSGDTQSLIGFLVNTLAIRHKLEPGACFRDVLRAVRRTVLESFDHREVPFEHVVRAVAPTRHADRSPLFQVLFQYGVSAFTAAPDFSGVAAEQVERQSEASKFDFTMYLEGDGDTLAGNLVYNTDLFDASTIAQLIDDFDRLAHQLVTNPDSVIHAKADLVRAPSDHGSTTPVVSDQFNTVDPVLLARMCDIWGEVIGTKVGPDDNFFELGGHSLTAIRAYSRIDAEWDIGLPISAIFESPTPRSFVGAIEKLRSGTATEAALVAAKPPIERSPLSFAQRRLWFLHMLTPEAGDYHTPWRVRLKGDLSIEALQHAIDTIIARHPVFRTRIQEDRGVPFQVVDAPRHVPLRIIEVGPSPSDVATALRSEASAPFDLAIEHPIRTTVFRIAPDDHILSIVAHHIATDADSMSIVRNDLQALYTAHLSGASANLPDVLGSYAQFATEQARHLTPDDPDLDWWLKTLDGSTSNLDLPTDRIRPRHSGGEAGLVRRYVDRDVSDAIQRLAQDEGMTPFMTYLAAYALLIYRSTRQDDFVVGIPSNERNSVEMENVVGFFVNPLPIRIRIDPGFTLRQFFKQIRSTVLDALAHRHVPFDAVVEHLDAPRDPSRTPVFQTMFDSRSAHMAQLDLPHLSTVPLSIPLGPHPAKFDVRTHVTDVRGDVKFLLEYRSDLFDQSTIDAMADHFSALLKALADEPDVRIDMLRVESTVPESAPRSIPSASLIELVDNVIGRVGSAIAVIEGSTSYSYAEIGAASHEVAKGLSKAGVRPGDTVGIQMPRGAGFVAAIVGIVRSGAVYVPLDLGYPQARIDTIAKDAGLRVILSPGTSIDRPLVETRVVAGDPYPVSDRMAYIMYTSGSTGSPKGVEIEEASIINLVCDPDYVQIDSETVIGFASNTGFDAATFEVWGTLLNGATLHVLDNATLLAPETLTDEIRISGITVMFLTSALFNAVILHSPGAFSSLDTLMIGGEALDPDKVRLCLSTGPPRRLVNAYGPTEATTFATWKLIGTVPNGAKSIPIGTAIAGASVSVVDANLNPLPTGAPGELVIGGHGLAAGYRGNPRATAERFVMLGGKRMYRTGDLVRRSSNGDIEFLGRIDRQIKLRGFRIEPGEIEAHLRSHPAIEQAHVVVRATEHDSRLVAYVVGQVTPQTAIDHLYPLLPGFMIPTAAVVLNALPITPNGKIDDSALPAPDNTQPTSGTLHGEAQIAMARLWEEALEIDGIGADSNFFDLGGHSLLAIRLMAAIEQHYGERLPLSALFEAPTLSALTALISGPRTEPKGPMVTIKSQGSGSPIVCMPPAGGNVMTYELMSRTLNAGRPIVGIEAVGLDGAAAPLNTVEALADHCRTSITAQGITGPYVLAGYSLGGLIAYEVARRLRDEGEEVELVVVIDARVRPKKPAVARTGERRMPQRKAQARNIPPLTKRVALGVRRVGGRLRHGPKTVIARATGRPLSPRLVERLMFRAAAKAASIYEAGPYDGRMLFILAGDVTDPNKAGVIAAWRQLVGPKLEIVGVPGTHRGEESLMRAPHAERVAEQIQEALTAVSTKPEEPAR